MKKSIHRQIEWLNKQIKLQEKSIEEGLADGRFTPAQVAHRRACAESLLSTLTGFRDLMTVGGPNA